MDLYLFFFFLLCGGLQILKLHVIEHKLPFFCVILRVHSVGVFLRLKQTGALSVTGDSG